MKRNVTTIVLLELALLAAITAVLTLICGNSFDVTGLFDLTAFAGILVVVIPGLAFMGEWKNFVKAFSVGRKKYALLELKNINGAVAACQKLVLYAGVIEFVLLVFFILGHIDDLAAMGGNVSVALLTVLYVALFEYLLVPVKLNAERVMNEEMDIELEE